MAKLIEQNIVVRISRVVKNNQKDLDPVPGETLQALEQVAQELLGPDVIVEVEQVA